MRSLSNFFLAAVVVSRVDWTVDEREMILPARPNASRLGRVSKCQNNSRGVERKSYGVKLPDASATCVPCLMLFRTAVEYTRRSPMSVRP